MLLQVLSICFAAGAGPTCPGAKRRIRERDAGRELYPALRPLPSLGVAFRRRAFYSARNANPRERSSATIPSGPTRCSAPTATNVVWPERAISAILSAMV